MDNKEEKEKEKVNTYREGSWLYVSYNKCKEKDTASTTTWQVQRFKQ